MRRKQLAAAAITVLLAGVGPAGATSYTLTGTDTVSVVSGTITGNQPSITNYLGTSFTETGLNLGTATSEFNFVETSPNGNCGSNCVNNTASEEIKITFNFTIGGATGSTTVYAWYLAKYSGSHIACDTTSGVQIGPSSYQTDCIVFSDSKTSSPPSPLPGPNGTLLQQVSLSNGQILDVTFYNAEDWDITSHIGFELQNGPNQSKGVPGPVMGAGFPGVILAAVGLLAWERRRRRAPSKFA